MSDATWVLVSPASWVLVSELILVELRPFNCTVEKAPIWVAPNEPKLVVSRALAHSRS